VHRKFGKLLSDYTPSDPRRTLLAVYILLASSFPYSLMQMIRVIYRVFTEIHISTTHSLLLKPQIEQVIYVYSHYFQVNDTLKFIVTLEDEVGEGLPNNLVQIPVTAIVLDENDNAPIFKDVSNFHV
jgi:hypothetical protein